MQQLMYSRQSVQRAINIFMASLLLLLVYVTACYANETTERRVKIALPLFPRIVAVDNNFQSKLTDDNKARLVFIYDRDQSQARELAREVGDANKNIVNIKVDSVPVALKAQLQETALAPTAIFVAEPLGESDFKELVLYGIKKGIIVFSPYSGDVERGATVGLSITSRVFPYFNNKTLEASGVEINPILLDMSKRYE